MIHTGNFLPQLRGHIVTADELCAVGWCWENAGGQQRLRVGIQQVSRNGVVRERLSRRKAVGCVFRQDRGRDGGWNRDQGAAEVAAVGTGQRNRLVEYLPLNQTAPLHVVEEECRMVLPERSLAAEVEAVCVEAQFGYFCRRRIEVVACIEGIITREFPSRSVKLFGA